MNGSKFFLEREKQLLGDRFDSIFAYSQEIAKGVTVNPMRISPKQFYTQSNLSLQPSPFSSCGFFLQNETKPGKHPYHHAGAFYVQEPSASSVVPLLELQPGLKVADLCAAPGGKTSQIGGALQGNGFLLANEYHSTRVEVLKSNLERMGIYNALITNQDTKDIAKIFPNFFDRVLVDAPCSGEGMFRKEPQAIQQHCQGLVQQCAKLGKDILKNAATILASGGILVYSTCTFSPEENEMQVASFLQEHPEFELMDCQVEFGMIGEENRCGGIPLQVEYVRRIWPCNHGEGHFIAKLRKKDGLESEILPTYSDCKRKKGKKVDLTLWKEFVDETFGQQFEYFSDAVQVKESIYLPVKQVLPKEIEKLNIIRNGVFAGKIQKGRIVPSHQLFMAFGHLAKNVETLSLSDEATYAWLRGEEIDAVSSCKGWCSVLIDGMPLGFGKNSSGRIKNHYPKALRNLK